MKTLLRMTVPAVVVWACALPAPRQAAAQVQEPSEKLAYPWQVLVRPRAGYFAPQWQYGEGQSLPRRPSAGVEVLVRPGFSWYGARLLLERPTNVQDNALLAGINPGQPPLESYQSVIADFIYYPIRTEDVLPYFFAGGGMKVYTAEGAAAVPFPIPFFGGERRAAFHAGIGFEVPVKRLLLAVEVGDYYGEIMNFGKVHDMHVNMVVGFTGFMELFKSMFRDRSEELKPPPEERR